MRTVLVTTATTKIMSLDYIKDHLRIERGQTVEDDLLKGLRQSALDYAQSFTNRVLTTGFYKVYFDDWPCVDREGISAFEIPYPPLRSIPSTGLKYTLSSGGSTTFGSTKWQADTVSEPGRLVLRYDDIWPTGVLSNKNPIEISFNAGYSSTNLPPSIKTAMLLMIASWYEGREDSMVGAGILYAKMPMGAKALMSPYRIFRF